MLAGLQNTDLVMKVCKHPLMDGDVSSDRLKKPSAPGQQAEAWHPIRETRKREKKRLSLTGDLLTSTLGEGFLGYTSTYLVSE